MSSNRIRDQFSSVGFNFADPLALTAANAGIAPRSGSNVMDDQSLRGADHARIELPAHESHSADLDLGHAASLGLGSRTHSNGAVIGAAAKIQAAIHGGAGDAFSAAPKFAAPNLSASTAADASVRDFAHQGGVSSILQQHNALLGSTAALHAGGTLAGAQGMQQTAGSAPGHAPGGAPPPVGAVAGQLWAAFGGLGTGNADGHSDFRVEHADSDGLSNDWVIQQSQVPSGGYTEIGLDTSANLSITLDGSFHLRVTNLATGADLTNTVIASTADFDVVNGFALDANSNTLYVDLFGYDYLTHGGDIIKITYNQTTGVISNPYTFNDGTHSGSVNTNGILIDSASTSGATKYADGRAFFLSHDGSTLYYVDDNNNDPGGYWGFSTNAILKVSTTGDVGHGTAPTPVLLSNQAQFPTNDSAGYITGIAVSEAKGIIYFTTDGSAENVNTSQDGIWWMPITGGTATKMTIPGGVSVKFPVFYGNALDLDIKSQQLYYSDKQTGQIVQFTLAADGHSFVSAVNFAAFDSNGGTDHDGAFANAMAFDDLPTLAPLSATSTEAVQGGSALTLLTATPSISDVDNINLRGTTITITNAQSGDILLLSGSQSGSASGVSWSYNSSTHVMTLSGEASFSTYQSLLTLISYQDTGTDNSTGSHPTRTINWTISDGVSIGHPSTADSNEQTTVVVIDRAPTLTSDNYAVLETATSTGTAGTGGTGVFANDTDKDGDAFTITAVNGSAGNVGNSTLGVYGHLTLNANGSYSYTADITAAIDAAPNGSHPVDTFTYTVSDGLGGVSTTTVTFTIDRPPTVATDSGAAVESFSGTGNVLTNDSDKDGDSLTVSAVNGSGGNVGISIAGTYGHITINANGSYTYNADNTVAIDAAATGSHLTDSFTYTANDAHGGTTSSTITITLDRPPTVASDAGAAVEALTGTGNVLTNDSDRDADSLTVSAVNGSGGNVGNFVAGTYGHLKINADGSYTYNADNIAAIDGAATGSHLTDTFSYTANDGHGGTTTTNIVITLDRPPTVASDAGAAVESFSGTGNVLTNDSDRDGDTLVVSAVAGSAGNVGNSIAGTYGHLTLNSDGSYTYLADNTAAIDSAATGSHLTDTFSYTASDGHGGTTTTNLVITLDRAPTVADDGTSLAESGTASATAGTGVLANDSDRDGDSLVVSAVAGSAGNVGSSIATTYGHITLNADGSYTYNADNTSAIDGAATGSHPIDSITLTVSDGQGGTTDETLSFTIDRPAAATADAISTFENQQAISGSGGNANVLDNDSDPDGDSIAVTAVNGSGANVGTQITLASGALLTLNADGTYTYDPNHVFDYLPAASSGANSQATDTFSYTITGGSTVSVTVTINGVDSNDTLQGTVAADTFSGGIGDDTFKMQDGGNDTVNGDSGNDVFFFGASFTAADSIDGGTNSDRLSLNGNYTGGNAVVFGTTTMVNVETITVVAGNSYDLTTNDATVANGQTLTISAAGLGAGDSLTFNGSAESNGSFIFNGGGGTNVLTGGANGDTFVLKTGSTDTLAGGGGSDLFNFGAAFVAGDQVDGGTGTDTLSLNGNYAGGVIFNANTITNIETIMVQAGHSYNLTLNDGNLTTGQTLTVNAAGLGSSDSLTFDGSAESTGAFALTGGAGNDVLSGGGGNDTFTLTSGGADQANGGGGDDTFIFAGAFTAADQVDGGTGNDKVTLNADYSGGVIFNANTMVNVETIQLLAGHSYNLTTNNATVASGQTLTVNGASLGAGDVLTFVGSAETDGNFLINGGAGGDTLGGGAGNDTINGNGGADTFKMQSGGNDTVNGGDGDDVFFFDGNFTAADQINGGSGNDRLSLNGDYTGPNAVVMASSTLVNVETITLIAGHSYDLTTANATVPSVHSITIAAGGLGAGDSVTFNGSAETDGTFIMNTGAGNDVLTGGLGNDVFRAGEGNNTIKGGGGIDNITGGSGVDTFVYGAVSESTSVTHDIIQGFNASNDLFDLSFAVTGIDATVASGHLSQATFDADLQSALNGHLTAYNAILFTPTTGSYAGHTILIVDANGVAGYQANHDLVIDLQNPTDVNIATGNFI
jgi:VCBS repeat-containing protein